MKTTVRGHLNEASNVLHQAMISSCVALWPGFSFDYWRRTRRFEPTLYEGR